MEFILLLLICSPVFAPIPRNSSNAGNACNYYASDTDMRQQGLLPKIKDYCKRKFKKTPDAVTVNPDQYPYKMCLTAGKAEFTDLRPSDSTKIVADDEFTNRGTGKNVSHTFELHGDFMESISLATTTTVSFKESVSFEVDIPKVLSSKFEISLGFKSSKTEDHKNSNDAGFESTTTVVVPSDCTYYAKINAQIDKYSSKFKVPICLDGYARCQFGEKVEGHYFWYVTLKEVGVTSSAACVKQSGGLASSIAIKSSTVITKSGKGC